MIFSFFKQWLSVVFLVALLLATHGVIHSAQADEICQQCHAKPGLSVTRAGQPLSLFVDPQVAAIGVHADLGCVDCHTDLDGVESFPHETGLARVDCGQCHEADSPAIATFWASRHGQLAEAGHAQAPLCQDCHGKHGILSLADPNSAISPFNVPQMCTRCHVAGQANASKAAQPVSQAEAGKRYPQVIHGQGLFVQGVRVTAVCTSCHGGHQVLAHTDSNSSIHKDNIRATCLQCHGRIEVVHQKVVAKAFWQQGEQAPLCVDCHAPHSVRQVYYETYVSNADCLGCHGEAARWKRAGTPERHVEKAVFAASVHGREGIACVSCHIGVDPTRTHPCATLSGPVSCAVCHAQAVTRYQRGTHGQLQAAGNPYAPNCTECHGVHNMLEHQVPEGSSAVEKAAIHAGPTYIRNVPDLCGRCHRQGGKAAQHYFGDQTDILSRYTMSIHGKGLLESGLTVTAACTHCHTPHQELPSRDPASTVSPDKIAATCGQCHDGIYEQYRNSIHGVDGNPGYQARQTRDMASLPHCNDCHSAHGVSRTDGQDFRLGVMEQCGGCHEAITASYFDTYHGKASALGDTSRAKCYDCHGAHAILPLSDPNSPLHPDNIVKTCGQCHLDAHPGFTDYLAHGNHHDVDRYPMLFYAFWIMTGLLVATFSFFGLHTLVWLVRAWIERKKQGVATDVMVATGGRQFVRFSRLQRLQHITMIISFFGLVLTGMMLKFAYTPWAGWLFTVFGHQVETAGWIHRICALLTFLYFGSHLWDLGRRWQASGLTLFRFICGPNGMMPHWSDLDDFVATVKWFLGQGPRPQYGRWTYWEKFDYFAVFWGVTIIGSTGMMLWFPEFFTHFFPGWSINVATIIHSDEALLATGFIFTVHFFNTHFRPDKFPMDMVIFTGRMSLNELKWDKPRLYEELAASEKPGEQLAQPPSEGLKRLVHIFGMSALTVGVVLVFLIIFALSMPR